jgi:hypothetical protein
MTEPQPLWTLAKLVRSKNAGPFTITIDIMFDDPVAYERAKASDAIAVDRIAELYGVDQEQVLYTEHDVALALKISIPRRHPSGSLEDTDVFGGQFHGPLVDLLIA